jgi:hypothetical protein
MIELAYEFPIIRIHANTEGYQGDNLKTLGEFGKNGKFN